MLRCYGATMLRVLRARWIAVASGRSCAVYGLWLVLISRLYGSGDPEALSSDLFATSAQRLRPESRSKAMVAAVATSLKANIWVSGNEHQVCMQILNAE